MTTPNLPGGLKKSNMIRYLRHIISSPSSVCFITLAVANWSLPDIFYSLGLIQPEPGGPLIYRSPLTFEKELVSTGIKSLAAEGSRKGKPTGTAAAEG